MVHFSTVIENLIEKFCRLKFSVMQVLPYSYFVSYFEAAKFPNYVKKLSKAIVSVIPHFRENGIEMNCT